VSEQRHATVSAPVHATVSAPVHPSAACTAEQLLIPSFFLLAKEEIRHQEIQQPVSHPSRIMCAYPVTPTVREQASVARSKNRKGRHLEG
jgi:hypothetical protein